ncbi:MAG: KH domain-containing protein [Clostridia bacterium]|nr:KH domain-containing protein [Clostridia bacterium]
MQKELYFEGKTLELAIKSACANLCIAEDDLTGYEVVSTGKKGFLGLGGEMAKIKVFVEMTAEEEAEIAKQKAAKEAAKAAAEKEVKAPAKSSAPKKETAEDFSEYEKKAVEFLAPLCEKILGKKVDLSVSMEGRNMIIDIAGEDMGVLIGRRGETLDSIQYLTSLAINERNSGMIKVFINTENYREKREKTLEDLAKRTAKKVLKSGRSYTFEPMPPYERRILHATLQEFSGIVTYSVGQEPKRKVVIAVEKNSKAVQKNEK